MSHLLFSSLHVFSYYHYYSQSIFFFQNNYIYLYSWTENVQEFAYIRMMDILPTLLYIGIKDFFSCHFIAVYISERNNSFYVQTCRMPNPGDSLVSSIYNQPTSILFTFASDVDTKHTCIKSKTNKISFSFFCFNSLPSSFPPSISLFLSLSLSTSIDHRSSLLQTYLDSALESLLGVYHKINYICLFLVS